uniref:UBR-type domain-containing protein n=1 Tax=Rousettus aegyptiacus TaxID=9407 RepID=A0A7J8IM42_ROUAE|nr:hypothetical protein HJG63_010781 [Rousettus aegyptiacus]
MAGAEGPAGRQSELEPVVSLVDVLEEDEELENEACAVLGGSDSEKCSYSQGSVKRQALYACSTCTPEGEEPAGICLACSYECHGSHKLFELYTKRNFRCDCGNSKFKNLECKLFPDKAKINSGNKYNDNFFGLYCICKRPYPDPEDEIPDEMIQCVVCEDWFHGRTAFKNQRLNTGSQSDCKLQELQAKHFIKKDAATYWPLNWRSKLCTCKDCMKMYGDLDVLFLTDEYDTVLAYENKGKVDQAADRTDPLMDTLNSMSRVQQVELICEYNDLKTELKDYLKRFADEGTVVKREDIQQFFEEFQSKKRRRVDGMQYYCS